MARVLVTGAAGFVGSHLAARCLDHGHDVIGVDSFSDYYDPGLKRRNIADLHEHPSWSFFDGDLVELDLASVLAGVNVVYHLAAQPGVRSSWGQTFQAYVDSNVTAMQRLLEACVSASPDRFIFASSSSVYGDAEAFPTHESAILRPVSPYGATKVLGEHLCRLYHRSYDLPVVVLRYFTVYGPRQRPDMAFNRLITAALEHNEIVLYGDGNQTRDFTFIADAVDATLAAGRNGGPGTVYNIGGGSRTSMNRVLEILKELTGESLGIRHEPAQRGDARHTAADTARARDELGFAPSRSLAEGLTEQIAWHRSVRDASGTESLA